MGIILFAMVISATRTTQNTLHNPINRNGTDSFCTTSDYCNDQYMGNRSGLIKCYGKENTTVQCEMCKWSSNADRIGCDHESGIKNSTSRYVTNDGVDGNYFVCYGDFCNTNDPSKKRKCYVGQYGDCKWTYEHENICVHQIWTHKTKKNRVCHKFRCEHQLINHGYKLVHNQLPNLTAGEMYDEIEDANVTIKQCVTKDNQNCFKIEPPPKIKCYVSNNASLGDLKECNFFVTRCSLITLRSTDEVKSRDCSPSNIAFDDNKEMRCYNTTDYQTCHFLGDSSNNLPAEKNCWTGIEGDCKPYINKEIPQAFFHKPKETYCHGWDDGCYKAVFNGTCTWYDCERFSNNHFDRKDNIKYEYPRHHNNSITLSVDHYRCSGENCNTPKDSANDLGSNLALMLLVIGLLNVLE
uniref:Uncharacterized protein n=1 Tax=Panagrolaimus sp. JU765 TaxID=591449 RepID=A0AC34RFH8_9BILA